MRWNETAVELPPTLVHEMFEAQVASTPDAVAAEFDGATVSYKELNERANRLAHYLRELDVGPEVLVGLCVDRSIEMVVAMMAILKAGGAYLPLDSEYPSERLAFMIRDSDPRVLIAQSHLLEKLPQNDARVVLIDEHWDHFRSAKAILVSSGDQAGLRSDPLPCVSCLTSVPSAPIT
jgi:non-ribosomal peptide synthetase component F